MAGYNPEVRGKLTLKSLDRALHYPISTKCCLASFRIYSPGAGKGWWTARKWLLYWTGLSLTQTTVWREITASIEWDLLPVVMKMPCLTGSWQVRTSGTQKLPGANWARSARLRCPGAPWFPMLTEKVISVVKWRNPSRNNRAFCRLQWPRGLEAPGWPKCLSPRRSLYKQALVAEKANSQA